MASSPSTVNNPGQGQSGDFAYKSYRTGIDGSVAAATTNVGDWGYFSTTAAATNVVKTGAGQLGTLLVLGGTIGAITIFDNTAASGALIAAAFTPAALAGGGPGAYVFNVAFSVGLTIVTAAATVYTVMYR
jgi:hypothetical protein